LQNNLLKINTGLIFKSKRPLLTVLKSSNENPGLILNDLWKIKYGVIPST
jgi:hypothetical protein